MLPSDELLNEISQLIANCDYDQIPNPDNKAKILALGIQAMLVDKVDDLVRSLDSAADDLFNQIGRMI